MSNETNREEIKEETKTVTPGDLDACDFFPPGHGWNKEASDTDELKRKAAQFERARDEDIAIDGARPH